MLSDQNDLENQVAGGPGFEPGLEESESTVLPLNYPPIGRRPYPFVLTTVGPAALRTAASGVGGGIGGLVSQVNHRSPVDGGSAAAVTVDLRMLPGRVAEWFKAAVLKTAVGATLPWVRIPPLPPASR